MTRGEGHPIDVIGSIWVLFQANLCYDCHGNEAAISQKIGQDEDRDTGM